MDNFYNSVDMSEALLAQGVHTVGTLRNNRGEPLAIRNPQRMQRHEVIAMDNGKVMVLAWKESENHHPLCHVPCFRKYHSKK